MESRDVVIANYATSENRKRGNIPRPMENVNGRPGGDSGDVGDDREFTYCDVGEGKRVKDGEGEQTRKGGGEKRWQ